jgi:hypothetical protein
VTSKQGNFQLLKVALLTFTSGVLHSCIYIYTQYTWIVNKIPVQCPPLFLFKPDKMLVISVLILTYVYLRVKPVSWIQYGQRFDMTNCYEMP